LFNISIISDEGFTTGTKFQYLYLKVQGQSGTLTSVKCCVEHLNLAIGKMIVHVLRGCHSIL